MPRRTSPSTRGKTETELQPCSYGAWDTQQSGAGSPWATMRGTRPSGAFLWSARLREMPRTFGVCSHRSSGFEPVTTQGTSSPSYSSITRMPQGGSGAMKIWITSSYQYKDAYAWLTASRGRLPIGWTPSIDTLISDATDCSTSLDERIRDVLMGRQMGNAAARKFYEGVMDDRRRV